MMGENTQQLPRNSQERRLRGARSVLPSSIRQQPSWPFHNYHFSSKEEKDGGAMHLGGGGENAPSLVRGLCLQDSQRSDGTLLHAVLCKLNLDYILSCSMSTTMLQVMFFLAATVKLQEDDNACLWIPTFLVPAFLSTIVAVICVCLFVFACVCLCLFFVGYLSSPYFFLCYTIYTISFSSHSLSLIYAPICAAKCFYFYQCCLSLIFVLL